MHTRAISLFAILLLCAGLSAGLAACGGDDDSTTASVELTESSSDPQNSGEPSAPQPPAGSAEEGGGAAGDGDDDAAGGAAGGAEAAGKAVFTQSCAGCHTLADAGANGSVGPNLDDLRPSQETVATMVRNGGGGMPSFGGTLEPEQIEAVAAYVAGAAGS